MNALQDSVSWEGKFLRDEPMSRHTSWRVGGPADIYFQPATQAELERFLEQLDAQTPVLFVGLGSNLLVRDGGIRGAVVNITTMANFVEQLDDHRLRVGAGMPCTTLARTCVRLGLGPAAFFAGIPGSLGGALAMNAGAFGGETWERVQQVTTIDRVGVLHRREPDEFTVGYREVGRRQDEWFVEAVLKFDAEPDSSMADIRALVAQRKATQPIGQASCGSVFRNPPGDFSARLIELSGLKGLRHGGAQVSEKHANFIINTGDASATDVEALIEQVRAVGRAKAGRQIAAGSTRCRGVINTERKHGGPHPWHALKPTAKNGRNGRSGRLPGIPWRRIGSVVLVSVSAVVLFNATQYVLNRPVQALDVQSTFQRVSAVQVEEAVATEIHRGFLAADLDRLRHSVEGLEWVEKAEVERRWPDTFLLRIEERTAAARWGDTGLLDRHGKLFAQSPAHLYPELPVLTGPVGTERTVAEMYLALRGRLAEANLSMTNLTLDERWAWSFELDDGTRIELGRRDVDARVERFFKVVQPALAARLSTIAQVDMRYSNGFAVAWHDSAAQARADLVAGEHRG